MADARSRREPPARLRCRSAPGWVPALRFLAAAIAARAVVEVGTGTGRQRACGCCAGCAPTAC